MKNLTTGLIAFTLLIFIGLGCSSSDTKTANSAPANSSDNKNSSNSSKTQTPTAPTSGDLAGSYSVAGKNPNGKDYAGELTVKKQGDEVYQFTWTTGNTSYDGAAIQGGDLVAVGFSNDTQTKGCGAAVYKIGDTSMDGKLVSYGFSDVATQTATLVSSTKTSGVFNLGGKDTDGSDISGTLEIKQTGNVYQLTYGGKGVFHGTGIRQGDYLAVGVGRSACGYAVYEINNGTLKGIWGSIGSSKIGAEVATKK